MATFFLKNVNAKFPKFFLGYVLEKTVLEFSLEIASEFASELDSDNASEHASAEGRSITLEVHRCSKEVFRSEIKMPSESYYDRDYWITLYQKFSNIKDKIYLKKLVKIDFKVQTSSPMRAWPAGPLLKITAIKQFFTPQVLKMLYFTATRET